MIESRTRLPSQGGGSATILTRSRQAAASAVGYLEGLARLLKAKWTAAQLQNTGLYLRQLAHKARGQAYWTRLLGWVRLGTGDGPLLSRMALHLVVVLLAVGVVTLTQVSIPKIDFFLPTPTPGPDLGERTMTAQPSSRGLRTLDYSTSNVSTALYPAPVPHTTIPERDRLEVITYTVQPNDNLWVIAQGFGLQVETIAWANPEVEKAPDLLSVGQTLVILPVDGIYYTAKAGDSIAKIAKVYETTAEKIIGFSGNALAEPYTLEVGQKLILPDGRKQAPKWQNIYPMTFVGAPPKGAATGSGRFSWPTRGTLTQGFWSAHMGIDIASRIGVPIYAADAGYVRMAGRDTYGYGNQVVIDHGNGFYTRYAHLDTILVKAGESVQRNQKIGTMGNTGRSTGPHLHFEVIQGGVQRNPIGFLP